jgi:hypothetical protein
MRAIPKDKSIGATIAVLNPSHFSPREASINVAKPRTDEESVWFIQPKEDRHVRFLGSSNVGFNCKRGWRGPGASQVRDRRDCWVQAFARQYV